MLCLRYKFVHLLWFLFSFVLISKCLMNMCLVMIVLQSSYQTVLTGPLIRLACAPIICWWCSHMKMQKKLIWQRWTSSTYWKDSVLMDHMEWFEQNNNNKQKCHMKMQKMQITLFLHSCFISPLELNSKSFKLLQGHQRWMRSTYGKTCS